MEVYRADFLLVWPFVISVSVCLPGFVSVTVTEVAGVILAHYFRPRVTKQTSSRVFVVLQISSVHLNRLRWIVVSFIVPQNEFHVGTVQTLHVHPGESRCSFFKFFSIYFAVSHWSTCVFQRCHNYMTDQLGIPVWGSYVIFGLVTLFSGLALGLVGYTWSFPWWWCCAGSEASTLTVWLCLTKFRWQCFLFFSAAAAGLHRRFCLPLSTVLRSGLPPEWVSTRRDFFFFNWCFLAEWSVH